MNKLFKYRIDHIAFWVFTIIFHAYTRLDVLQQAGISQFLFEVVLRNTLLAAVVYFTLHIIIPEIVGGRKIAGPVLMLCAAIAVYVIIKDIHDIYLDNEILKKGDPPGLLRRSWYNFSIVIFYLSFASAMHFTKQWYLQREHIRQIELEKLNTELEYLKAQINPHFLFNSLNTVFFQIDKQNIAARETLSRFSDMLRYQLYECNGKEIDAKKEIDYLKNYVELQKLRTGDNYSIDFVSRGDSENFKLPPMLLLPFVENAFKHVSHFSDKENSILIELTRLNGSFHMRVQNTTDPKNQPENGGIGLKNVRRRLELLYENNYQLEVGNKGEFFEVNLNLKVH